MKYIKPHLSPELRAQITPANRRERRLAVGGVFFLILSGFLTINLLSGNGDKDVKAKQANLNLSTPLATSIANKEILGASTQAGQEQSTATEETTTPVVTPPPAQTPAQDFTEYAVKAGDTLFNISQQYNIKWDLIAQINNLSEPYVLHSGQKLKIPQATTSAVPNKVYTIKSGDTLASIAKAFNITVSDIIAVNPNLQKSDLITVGQIIKLP